MNVRALVRCKSTAFFANLCGKIDGKWEKVTFLLSKVYIFLHIWNIFRTFAANYHVHAYIRCAITYIYIYIDIKILWKKADILFYYFMLLFFHCAPSGPETEETIFDLLWLPQKESDFWIILGLFWRKSKKYLHFITQFRAYSKYLLYFCSAKV